MLLSLPISYFLLAPKDMFGLSMGATGLALKMVITQFLIVNINLFIIRRILNISISIVYQIIIIFLFLGYGFLVKFFVESYIISGFVEFFLSGVLYICLFLWTLYLMPFLIDFNKPELILTIRKIFRNR